MPYGLWKHSAHALNHVQFCEDASGFTAPRQVQSAVGPHSHPGLRPPLEHRFTAPVTYLITFGHRGELDSVFPSACSSFYSRVGQEMNSLVCSHMQEESLGLNMGLYALFHQDNLTDTSSRTDMDEIRTQRMMGKMLLRRTNTVHPSHVGRRLRKPLDFLLVTNPSFLPSFLYFFIQPNHGHMEGIQTQHTLRKRHQVPVDLTLASRVIQTCSKTRKFPFASRFQAQAKQTVRQIHLWFWVATILKEL